MIEKTRLTATSSLVALALVLGGCGGSGGGGIAMSPTPAPSPSPTPTPSPTPAPTPAPTPTPAPSPTPTPTNTSVEPPLISGTFDTQAQITSVLYDRGQAQASTRGDAAEIAISYDAADNSYIVVNGAQTTRFGPSDATPSGMDFQFDRVDGDNEDRLLLSKGDQGLIEPKPRYVREGLFYSSTLNFIDDERSYSATSFVFGLPSDASAVASTGRAAHFITLRGAHSGSKAGGAPYDTLSMLSGDGSIQINFASGALSINADVRSANTLGQSRDVLGAGSLTGTASIASRENLFAGTFTASHTDGAGPLVYAGEWSGKFYGPEADEIGGTLYGEAGDYFYSASFAGREFAPVLVSDTLANLEGVTRFRTVRNGYQFPDTSGLDSQNREYFLTYDAGTQTWEAVTSLFTISFEPRNRVPANDADDLIAYRATQPVAGDGEAEYDIGLFDGAVQGVTLTYSSFMRILGTRFDASDTVVATSLDWIGFGIATPLDQIPLSGTSSYSGRLMGTLRQGADISAEFGGTSTLEVDFLARTLTASLSPSGSDGAGAPIAFGTYDFTGSVSAVDGSIGATLDTGSGSLLGNFYGNAAQEYVATFAIDDPALGALDGVSFGTIAP